MTVMAVVDRVFPRTMTMHRVASRRRDHAALGLSSLGVEISTGEGARSGAVAAPFGTFAGPRRVTSPQPRR